MTTALDVAGYIKGRARIPNYDSMKLQKLVYFAQAWHLAWTGKPLFDEAFEAWPKGPVVRSVYIDNKFAELPVPSDHFDEAAIETIEAVLAHYADKQYTELVRLTHEDEPWIEARAGLAETQPSRRPLSRSTMLDFYTHKALAGVDVPQRTAHVHNVGPRSAMKQAREVIREWSEGLELLAHK